MLVKNLVREFQRAGKKSLILAALFAVGLCIWLPMLWNRVFQTRVSSAKAPASGTPSKVDTSQPAGDSGELPQLDWKRIYSRVENSSVVQPLPVDELVRDPFDHNWIREKKTPPDTTSTVESAAESDPDRFLVLTATLAGSRGAAAIIGDDVYRVGQEVPKKGPIRFVLKEIRTDRVLLERGGSLYELHMKELEHLGKDGAELAP